MRKRVGSVVLCAVVACSPAAAAGERRSAPEDLLERGNALYGQGDLRGAIDAYSRAIELQSRFTGKTRPPAHAWNLTVDDGPAPSPSERITIHDPLNAVAYYNRATARFRLGDYAGAIADCDRALRIRPRYASAHLRRGLARKSAGDLAGAEADFDRVLELDPASVAALNDRGVTRQIRGDLRGALVDFERALALDPSRVESYNNRGAARCASGDLAGAIADFDRALALDGAYAKAYSNRGLCRLLSGDDELAEQDFRRAAALDARLQLRLEALAGALKRPTGGAR